MLLLDDVPSQPNSEAASPVQREEDAEMNDSTHSSFRL